MKCEKFKGVIVRGYNLRFIVERLILELRLNALSFSFRISMSNVLD